MVEIARFFAGLGGHLVLVTMVIGGFLTSLAIFFLQTRRIGVQIKRGLGLLEECSIGNAPGQKDDQDPAVRDLVRKQRFSANWQRFKKGMEAPEMHYFAQAWAEFGKHLVVPPANSGKLVRTTAEPSLYINERSLFFVNINSRLYDAVPGFLTAGGIFGTFVGLVAGIYLAQDGMSAGPNEMRQAMKFLMGGVSTAFLTSIFGIGLSVLFSVLEKRRQYWIGRLVQRFSEELESCLEMAASEDGGMNKMYAVQREQLVELQKLCQILKTPGAPQAAPPSEGAPRDMDARIGSSLAPALGKMFETLVKYQENQRESQQQSLRNALSPLLENLQNSLADKVGSVELALHALNENLRRQQEGQSLMLQDLKESRQEGLLHTAREIRETLEGVGVKMSTLMRESAEGSFGRLEQSVTALADAVSGLRGLQSQQTEAHEKFLGEFSRLGASVQGAAAQKAEHLDKSVASLNSNLDQQNERLAGALREAARELRETLDRAGALLSANLRQSAGDFDALVGHSVADLADVASGMKSAQLELAALLRDSSTGLAGRMERTLADLADVASGMKSAQLELAALLRDSSAGLAGRMERTIADMGSVAAGMKSAQQELILLLRESANSFSGQMGRSLQDLAQSSTAMLAVQNEMQRIFGAAPHLLLATEKLLDGLERFQGGLGEKLSALVPAPRPEASPPQDNTLLLDRMNHILDQSRLALTQESKSVADTLVAAGGLLLHAAESLEQTAAGLSDHFAGALGRVSSSQEELAAGIGRSSEHVAERLEESLAAIASGIVSHFASSVTQLSGSQSELATDFRKTGEQISSRLEESLGSLLYTVERMHDAQEELVRRMAQPVAATPTADPDRALVGELQTFHSRFEEKLGLMLGLFERLESNNLSALAGFDQRNQSLGSALQESRQKQTLDNAQLQTLLQATSASFQQSAAEMSHAAARMSQALQQSTQWSEESRRAMEGVFNFARSFDAAQVRFGQLIDSMESGAMMIAVAGEKLQTSAEKMESVTTTLNTTQETARLTLNAIGKAHELLRDLWHNYQNRFEQVDGSLERTFVQLNNGLEEFSGRVLQFIAGVDDHMGGITEKLGRSIGDFGSRLEDLDDSMSGFLEKMSSTLISPMQATSRDMILAGEKIQASISSMEGLSNTLSITHGATQEGAEQTLSSITEAQERMKATINLMQRQLESTWNEQQQRFELVNASLQQTVANLNSDLEDFSSEKVLEFIGGVDEHMDSVSKQLRNTIGEFNTKLDDLNDSISFFLQSMSNLR
ncbi:MAG: hypothetical protein HQL56_04420 [Magnetococcales bacterium]|nr:hypothetical protein [Magnetococcales bacterium]